MNFQEIELTQGQRAIVSVEDYEFVSAYKWHAQKSIIGKFYAHAYVDGKLMPMHRLITAAPEGLDVDHKNGDGLDNRRENLRLATRSQNLANTRKYKVKAATSGFKGVRFRKDCEKYSAQIVVMGKYIHLGLFRQAKEAACAYDEAARKYWGEFAGVNFPEPNAA